MHIMLAVCNYTAVAQLPEFSFTCFLVERELFVNALRKMYSCSRLPEYQLTVDT
jgi:hypothetical protein